MDHLEQPTKSRKGIIALIAAGLLASTVALAQNPHCIGDAEATQVNGTLILEADAAGLGGDDLETTTTVTGTAVVACVNRGGNRPPGLRRAFAIDEEEVFEVTRNGRAAIRVLVDVLAAEEDFCPGPQRAVVEDVDFDTVQLTGTQEGEDVLLIECTEIGETGEFACECVAL